MRITKHKKDIYIFCCLFAVSVLFRGGSEQIRILRYIGLLGIRGGVILFLQKSISQQQKEYFRAYGVVSLLMLLVCFTVYGLLSANRLLIGNMRYVCLTMLRALDVRFGQHIYRGSYSLGHQDILYLFAVAVAASICLYFLLGMQEERVFMVTTITLFIVLLGSRVLGSLRTHIFKQIKIWLLILVWGVFAVWQMVELFFGN